MEKSVSDECLDFWYSFVFYNIRNRLTITNLTDEKISVFPQDNHIKFPICDRISNSIQYNRMHKMDNNYMFLLFEIKSNPSGSSIPESQYVWIHSFIPGPYYKVLGIGFNMQC